MSKFKKILTSFIVLIMLLGSLFSNSISTNMVLAQNSEEPIGDTITVEEEMPSTNMESPSMEESIVEGEDNEIDVTIVEEVNDTTLPEVPLVVEETPNVSASPEVSPSVEEIIEKTKEPFVNEIHDGDFVISGTAEENALIQIKINDEVFEIIVTETKEWLVELINPLVLDQEVIINAKLENKEISNDVKIKVLPLEKTEEEVIEEVVEEGIDLFQPTYPDGIINDDTPINAEVNYNIFPETSFLGLSGMMMFRSSGMLRAMVSPTNPGQVTTSKTATPVPGMVNTWDITVRIEGKDTQKTSDIVLVIDTSGSMNDNGRITAAKDAAKAFVQTLLGEGASSAEYTRISVVSFDYYAYTETGLTNSVTNLNNAINGLGAGGGTFTQAGIRQAQAILANSDADYKNIVLLSDGEPTYSYQIDNPDNYLVEYPGYGGQTGTSVPSASYLNSRVGAGNNLRSRYYDGWGNSNDRYYNHGNSTIAEAGFAKTAGSTVWTIALEAGTIGTPILNSIASPGNSFTAAPADLNSIFQNIAGSISSAVTNATVTDPMGMGFTIPVGSISGITTVPVNTANYDSAANTITWNPGALTIPTATDPTVKYAELTYRVEITDEILNATPNGDTYSTNGNTVLTYTDLNGTVQTVNFEVPSVDPILLVLEKKLIDTHGNTVTDDGRVFTVQVTSNNGYNQSYNLTAGQKRILTNLRLEDTYTINENGFTGTPVTLSSDYNTTYNVYDTNTNTFMIRQGDPDSSVLVTNVEKPLGVLTISKVFKPILNSPLRTRGVRNTSPVFEFTITNPKGETSVVNLQAGETVSLENLIYGEYTVVETNTQGFVSSYEDDFGDTTDGKVTLSIDDKEHSVTVTNSPDVNDTYTTINGEKIWNGGPIENYNAIQLTLVKNGTPMDPQPAYNVTQGQGDLSNRFYYQWDNLQKYDDFGKLIEYTIQEDNVPTKYEATYSDDKLTVTNTYNPDITARTEANKIWVNGPTPRETVWFKLYRQIPNGVVEEVPDAPLKELPNGTIKVEWLNLPAEDNSGNTYTYSVKEVDVNGNPLTLDNYNKEENGLTITNTYVIPTDVSVTANKTWENGPEPRPVIYFKLFRTNGLEETAVEVPVVEITGTNLQAVWDNLERTDIHGNEYEYIVKEVNEAGEEFTPENYYQSKNGYDIKNIYVTPKIKITAQKNWVDGKTLIGEVTLQLQRSLDGVTFEDLYEPIVIDGQVDEGVDGNAEFTAWVYTWNYVEKTDENGTPYIFKIKELEIPNFNSTQSEFDDSVDGVLSTVITNTYVSPKITLNARKTWVNGSSLATSATFTLQRSSNGGNFDDVETVILDGVVDVSELEPWVYTWSNLDKTDTEGYEYTYKVIEAPIDNFTTEGGVVSATSIANTYETTITNRYSSPKISLNARKVWINGSTLATSATFILQRLSNGGVIESIDQVTLDGVVDVSELEPWVYTWTNLDKTDMEGYEYTYQVFEAAIDNFNTYGGNEIVVTPENIYETTITNEYIPPINEVIANKVWVNGPEVKPDVWFKLYRQITGGTIEEADDAEVIKLNGTQVIWEDIKQTDIDGNQYTFTVKEVNELGEEFEPENYIKLEEGLTVTNTYQIPKVIIKATKVWEGGDDLTKIATFQLQNSIDGNTFNNVGTTVTLDGNVDEGAVGSGELVSWVYTWDNIDKTDINGNPYTFKVVETPIDNFTPTGGVDVVEATENLFETTITNVYTPETISYSIMKKWNNNGVDITDIPESVSVTLTRKSTGDVFEDVQPVILEEGNNWQETISNLPKTDTRGNLYEYAVREEQVSGYGEPIYEFANNTFTVTNERNVVTKSVTKKWNSVEGEKTPVEITYVLLQDGNEIARETVTTPYSYTFESDEEGNALPEFNIVDNKNYDYTIQELDIEGYTSTVNQETGEVLNTQDTISKTVTKAWINNTNVANPIEVEVELHRNNTKYRDSIILNEANNWTHEFINLPEFDENGNEYNYTFVETNVPDGYTVNVDNTTGIITNTKDVISKTVSKVWINTSADPNPTSVIVNLTRSDGDVLEQELSENNNWTYTWNNLPTHDVNGNPFTYKITENDVPGYTPSIVQETGVITNTKDVKNIQVTKVWNTVEGENKPASVTINLLRNNVVYDSIILKGEPWTHTFENLPVKDLEDNNYTYTLSENEVLGYIPTIDDGTYTIINTQKTTGLTVSKEWVNTTGQANPESITIHLNRNNEVIDTRDITAAEGWKYEYTDLPLTNPAGVDYVYTITEDAIDGYSQEIDPETNVITNTINTTEVSVAKVWKTLEGETIPESIVINLLQNGEPYKETTLTPNTLTYTFENLPTHSTNGTPHDYTVIEVPHDGYDSEINKVEGVFVVTNTQKTTSKSVSKKWVNNTDEPNPTEITAVLNRNGEEYKTQVLNQDNGWAFTWDNLPLTDSTGKAYEYTVDEKEVVGYNKAIDSDVITNTKEVISLEVSKTWNDESGGINKPTSITVNLYRNDSTEVYKSLELSQGGNANLWIGEFTNLPKYNQAGEQIEYTIDEVDVPGYEKVVNDYSITNTRIFITIPVTKEWIKLDTEGFPKSITYKLLRDGLVVSTQTVYETDWNYEFTTDSNGNKLPQTNPLTGEDYEYTVEEENLPGYESKVEELNVINTQILIDVEVNKVWVGGNKPNTTIELWKQGKDALGNEINEKVDEFIATSTETKKVFENLPEYDPSGSKYTYYVLEPQVPANYTKTIEGLTVTNTFKDPVKPTNPPKDPEVKWTCADEGKVWNEQKQMCVYAYKAPNTSTNNSIFVWVSTIIISTLLLLWNNFKRRRIS